MGISGLWEVLGKGEEYAIADYAAAHWKRHKRPLRIAVDEACWRFGNLSDEQVARIREGEPAANPIEKTILSRILKLWRMNIQLLFITDGMTKPGKKRWNKKFGGGRGGSKVDKAVIEMLHKMFDRLHVPYHRAPGEAEAECSRLQELGVVDAVWSDDGDCLMFGCTTLIKADRNMSGQKDWDRIQVYRAEAVLPKFDFDTDSLVMFAVVAGGDYDDKCLPGCGHQKARRLCQRGVGLARALRRCESKNDFAAWRDQLANKLREKDYGVTVPPDFPYVKALDGYRNPAISTEERCRNLRGLHVKDGGWEWWENQMDQTKLRVVLRSHYNFQTREYLKHLGSVFLARALTRNVTPARQQENLSCGVTLRRTQNRKDANGVDIGQPAEVNIKFNPAMLVQINLAVQPPEEDWSCTVKNDGIQYDPTKPIDGVIMSCFLKHGLPEGALDKSTPSPKKKGRKSKADAVDDLASSQAGPSTSQQSPLARKPKTASSSTPTGLDTEGGKSEPRASQDKATKKRKARSEVEGGSGKPVKKSRKSKTAEKVPSLSPPPATFKRLEIPNLVTKRHKDSVGKAVPACGLVIDLDDDSDNDGNVKTHSKHNRSGMPTSPHSRWIPGVEVRSSQATTTKSPMPVEAAPTWSLPPANTQDNNSASQAFQAIPHTACPAPSPVSSIAPLASAAERPALPASPAMEDLDQTVTPSAAVLRQRREAGLLSKLSQPAAAVKQTLRKSASPPKASYHEMIDLT